MEINLGNNLGGAMGVMQEAAGAYAEAAAKPGASSSLSGLATGSAAGKGLDALAAAEPTADIPPESELVRADALGRLVNAAFNFPAPPPPEFG